MVNNCLTLEGQREYKDSIQRLWKAVDLSYDNPELGYKAKCAIPWYPLMEPIEDNLYKIPEVSSLPMWEVKIGKDKESKMYLTQLDPPSIGQVETFRHGLKAFLAKLEMPPYIVYPEEEELKIPSSNKCYMRDTIYEDRQKDAFGYGPCLYQSFMTGFDSPRECWLPSPEYKRSSRFWALVLRGIVDKVPYSCLNKSDSQIWKMLRNQIEPAISYDLKGSGLQFPHEYVITVAEELGEIFPDLKEEILRLKNLLSELEVVQDIHTLKIKRGVGLGYFTYLKCLAVWSILDGLSIKASFDDDMLIKADDYPEALRRMNRYSLVANDKKSGHVWNNVYWFIEAGICSDGLVTFTTEQADIAAIFRQRFHWERKEIVSTLEPEIQLTVAYHLERFYGREFFRGESTVNINEGGYCSCIPQIVGFSRSAYACKVKVKPSKKGFETIADDLFPTEKYTLSDRKYIHTTRKLRWNSRHEIHTGDSELTALLEPSEGRKQLEYTSYPSWAEALINRLGWTSGNILGDLTSDDVEKACIRYPHSSDPISWIFSEECYEPRFPTCANPEVYERYQNLLKCALIERRLIVNRSNPGPLKEIRSSRVDYDDGVKNTVAFLAKFSSNKLTDRIHM